MPGDAWQQFANLRAYLAFMWTHPGKKLLFMGGELAQPTEWNHDAALPWGLLDDPRHRGVQRLVRDLNAAYRELPALHRLDASPEGFRWVVGGDRDQSVFAWLRLGGEGAAPVLVVCNLTPVPREDYRIGVPCGGVWHEALNTDAESYGGTNKGNGGAVAVAAGADPRLRRLLVADAAAAGHAHPFARRDDMPPIPDRLLPGRPDPLGASWDGLGVNFAVFSANAERIDLCLFDAAGRREVARLPLPECTDEVWHGYLPEARPGQLYGYPRLRPLRAAPRAPLQLAQAAARPLCAPALRRDPLVGRAVRLPRRRRPRRPLLRPAGQRAGDAEMRRRR